MTEKPSHKGQGEIIRSALFGLCPRCGQKTLFGDWVQFADRCGTCGLDYDAFNVGDGPAAFLTLIIGALILGLALFVEFSFYPPLWVHVLLWFPLTIAVVMVSLRFSKALLLILEYQNQAHEGGLDDQASDKDLS